MSIFDVKSRLGGFQRSNKFFTIILAKNDFLSLPIDPISVTGTTLPGKNIGETQIYDFGIPYKIAGDLTYNDWTVQIRTWNFIDYRQFQAWFDMIHNAESKIRSKPNKYKTVCSVSQLNGNNIPIYTAILKGVYPKSISDLQYNDSNDDLLTFDVTFNVDNIISEASAVQNAINNLGI